MPTISKDQSANVEVHNRISKGSLFIAASVAFFVLWGASTFANHLIVTTLNPLALLIPLVLSAVVAWFSDRISKAYPGAASIIGYASGLWFAVSLSVYALFTIANGQSWFESNTNGPIIALVYPTVALGFARAIEVLFERLGINKSGNPFISHVFTQRERAERLAASSPEEIDVTGQDKVVIKKEGSWDFSRAVSYREEKGVNIVIIDFDELAEARFVEPSSAVVKNRPTRKPSSRKKK